MIHRDVKSDNVLLSGFTTCSLDDKSLVKIADFGTARADDRDSKGTLHTSARPTHASTKAVVGTTPYMPGEYIQSGHVSEKTDSFAFGIVVVEMLANMHSLAARDLVDKHEVNTLPQALEELAAKGRWPKKTAEILSSVATTCTRGTMTRTTPAQVLAQVESAYENATSSSAEVDEM
jgi:serine/threonine protein kinase